MRRHDLKYRAFGELRFLHGHCCAEFALEIGIVLLREFATLTMVLEIFFAYAHALVVALQCHGLARAWRRTIDTAARLIFYHLQ